jgi:hypothetical protein
MKIGEVGGTRSMHDSKEENIKILCPKTSERYPGVYGKRRLSWVIQEVQVEFNGVELRASVNIGNKPTFPL